MKTNLTLLLLLLTSFPFAQEDWSKYTDNPVLKRDTIIAELPTDFFAISDNWVIKEEGIYKMWYTCGGFNYTEDEFEMNARICYCESEDGINWEKHEGNPILDISYEGEWDSLGVETISVLIDPEAPTETRYKMWYSGLTGDGIRYDVGYAYSSNGINWVKHAGPVMTVGDPTEWDNGFIEGPCVLKIEDEYRMWYAGLDNVFDTSETDGQVNIGMATSMDGITWEKFAGNPVLSVSEEGWDSIYVQDPHVLMIDGKYYMWYGGANRYDNYGQQIGYASSSDGINWTKSVSNPVVTHGEIGEWDENTASFPTVILDDDNQLKMWYTGKDIHPLPEGSTAYYWEIGYVEGGILTSGLTDERQIVELSPNPFTSYIKVSKAQPEDLISIYSASGVKVYSIKLIDSNQDINLNFLDEGIYFVNINDNFISKMVKL